MCSCLLVSREHYFLVVIYCLCVLHSFHSFFCNYPWVLKVKSARQLVSLGLSIPQPFSAPWPLWISVLIATNSQKKPLSWWLSDNIHITYQDKSLEIYLIPYPFSKVIGVGSPLKLVTCPDTIPRLDKSASRASFVTFYLFYFSFGFFWERLPQNQNALRITT